MYRFFVEREQLETGNPVITGEDFNHLCNVLRMKPGEEVLLSDGQDREYRCRIETLDLPNKQAELTILDVFGNTRELPAEIVLFQGYPKGDKMEWIIQKAVELGATAVVPVMMKRCVVKLDASKAKKKVERLQAVALSAAKQSKRGRIPKVKQVCSFAEACGQMSAYDHILLPYENAEGMDASRRMVECAKGKKRIAVWIGPEGGFAPEEVEAIEAAGGHTITLGHRILRTETAGMTVLSLLMFLLEEDE